MKSGKKLTKNTELLSKFLNRQLVQNNGWLLPEENKNKNGRKSRKTKNLGIYGKEWIRETKFYSHKRKLIVGVKHTLLLFYSPLLGSTKKLKMKIAQKGSHLDYPETSFV